MDDKQKKMAMIGGGIAGGVVLVVLIAHFAFGGSSDEAVDVPTTAAKPGLGATPRPRQAQATMGQGETPGQATPANSTPAGKNKPLQIASVFPGRKNDPFYFERHIVVPPPNVFDQVMPKMIAVENTNPPPVGHSTVRVVPTRRVSGLMSGDGVYAILEGTNGDVEIVKPGSRTKDGYTVVAINPDSVILEQEDPKTHTTYTQTVMFSDASVSSTPNGGRGGNGGNGGPGYGNNGSGGPPPGAPAAPGDGGGG